MRRILALLAAIATLFVIGVPVARATVIEISIDTVVRAPEGSITVLATAETPADLVGKSCSGVAEATNQPSVHPGNDLIVESGDDSIVLKDVEREPGAITTAEALLTLDPTVTVSLLMGPDEIFSGGMVFTIGECVLPTTTTTEPPPTTTTEPPPTTTEPPPTTTVPPTTSTQAPGPAIIIEKLANPSEYGEDGVGHFTIRVTNPGPVDLTNIDVTDEVAVAIDPDSDCPNPDIPDLAVGEYYEYDCAVANLDGVSPFKNEATAIGVGPDGTEVMDTDDAAVFPRGLATTITRPPPTTVPPSTLPHTGPPFERVRGTSMAGFALLAGGIALLSVATLIGRLGVQHAGVPALGQREVWLTIETRPRAHTIYIPLRPAGSDPSPQAN